ncbi:uncharacterized protein LOC111008791 [Momordica charantia]|uniref:Uncharacterized protein LOC111008791 n=1 Tax=Momordica charantia TaxID=3673 RepID=A0A6J1C6U5_MOMCH|nr:uncharacterized protein LOC111008791 [Momordica charantia]
MAITNIFRFSLPTKSNPSTLPFDTSFTSSAYFLVSSPHFRYHPIHLNLHSIHSSLFHLELEVVYHPIHLNLHSIHSLFHLELEVVLTLGSIPAVRSCRFCFQGSGSAHGTTFFTSWFLFCPLLSNNIVIGTGGYFSFPICLAARLINGVKLAIQDQNSVPGFGNWVLSYFADVVFVILNSTIECFPSKKKCVVCGNPVRLALRQYVSKAVARLHFFPRSGKAEDLEAKTLLVLGGSLGANAINIAMLNLYYQMLLENKNLYIIWQTGVETFDEMDSLVKNHPHLHLTPFMHSLHLAYAAADLIVSRAGAMTCSEILATGKPSIQIPSPYEDEGHQFRNASTMADMAGSRVIDEDELDSTTLAIAIQEILGDESKMADMSERALRVSKPNASAEIVQHIGNLINLSTRKGKQQ